MTSNTTALPPHPLHQRHIVLALSGGVAGYKAAELCRLIIKAGATVQVVMSEAATRFITPTTMQALSGRPVVLSQWVSGSDAADANGMPHINTTRAADAVVLAPASADMIAKLAQGRADEIVSLMCLARPLNAGGHSVPLLVAPAMNREMWQHPATQRNLAQVAADGATVLGVGNGEQACGETGDGRMLEAAEIFEDLCMALSAPLLAGKRVLITAGPTYEPIDPVRGITNRSSGKMGFAIAQAARRAGAQVTLLAGPVALPTPRGVQRINVTTAADLLAATQAHAPQADIFIATAAVADWRVAQVAPHKLKKDGSGQPPALQFAENPDILATVAASPRAQSGDLYCVGFAAESQDLLANAQAKRQRKGVPLLVGNIGPDTFGRDDNTLLLVDAHGATSLPPGPKADLAVLLVEHIAARTLQRA